MPTQKPEAWQRGPVPGVPALLQPVAHALLQAREEVNSLMKDFPSALLWEKPAGLASPGFHLQHLSGVIDRLFTYARNEKLTPVQFEQLSGEGIDKESHYNTEELVERLNHQVDKAMEQLMSTGEHGVTEYRAVGRAGLPSTVLGLLFHSAEHSMRHVGQLLVTVAVIREKYLGTD